jgi:hypothetical protein
MSQIDIYKVKDGFDDVHESFIKGQQDRVKIPAHDERTLCISETVVALKRWEAINLKNCILRHTTLKIARQYTHVVNLSIVELSVIYNYILHEIMIEHTS